MKKSKVYRYLVDGVTRENLATLRKAIAQVPQVTSFDFLPTASTLLVESSTNPTASVELACRVAGVNFRAEIKQ